MDCSTKGTTSWPVQNHLALTINSVISEQKTVGAFGEGTTRSDELSEELGLNVYDFGARNYDPTLGRWMNIDPMAESFFSDTPYNYTLNNPISNIDPDGRFTLSLSGQAAQDFARNLQRELDQEENKKMMQGDDIVDKDGRDTDYILNRKTGKIERYGEENDEPDRIISVNKKGKIDVKIDNIAKGILKDGMNLMTNDNIINVNDKNLPTTKDVEDFSIELSYYIKKEVGGIYLSEKGDRISHITLGRYENNTLYKNRSKGIIGALRAGFTMENIQGYFHTHPGGARMPSDIDRYTRNSNLQKNPRLYFYILTKTKPGETGKSHRYNYTND